MKTNMDQQLREALVKGKEDYESRSASGRDKVRQEAEERLRKEREQEAYWRKRIREEPAMVFEKIREAVAAGKDEISFSWGDQALVHVLREIEGLEISQESGKKHINSDEFMEDYFYITVKWKKLP